MILKSLLVPIGAVALIIVVLLSLLYGLKAFADPQYTFSGTLKDGAGNTLAGITITLQGSTNSSAVSASNGSFSVAVQPGMYSLKVSGTGVASLGNITFSLAQPTSNPTIDLTSANISQDITLPVATVNFANYNAQGYPFVNTKLVAGSNTSSGSSVDLYPGGPAATTAQVTTTFLSTTNGTGSFKSFNGIKYTGSGTSGSNGICSYTQANTVIFCNDTSFTVSGDSTVSIPHAPAAKKNFSGTVKDSDGNQLGNLSVTLTDAFNNSVTSTTGSDGAFSVNVQPGMYALKINTNTTIANLGTFTLAQPNSSPTINLIDADSSQDIIVPLTTVNFNIYNAQGYSVPNSKLTFDATDVNSGSSVTLYPGGAPATLNKESSPSYISGGTTGTGSFKAIVGMKFTGASSNAICSWSNNNIKLLCLTNPYTITPGLNTINIPQAPAPRNTFSGVLKDSDGNTLSNVAVTLTDAYYNSVTTNTDSNGSYSLSVEPGMYSLRINTNNVIPGLGTFTLGQSTSNPTIDLTASNVTQDITVPITTVNFAINTSQGQPYANTNLTFDATDVNSGSSVVLYPGGAPATLNKESSPSRIYTTGTTGTGSFKAIVGMKFTGASSNRICSWSNYNILIQCLSGAYTIASGVNWISLPKPATPTGLSASSPTSYPQLSWQPIAGVSHYLVYRNGTLIGSSLTSSFGDDNVDNGIYTYQVSAIDDTNNEGDKSSSISVTVNQTPPVISEMAFSANPLIKGGATTATTRILGNKYGVIQGEYYIGDTDPGEGNGVSMTYSNGVFSATISGLSEGTYAIHYRARNGIGWSPTSIATLQVVKPVFSGVLKDSDGNTLSNVSITLANSSNTVSTTTASDGSYSVAVEPGMYALKINTNSTIPGLGTFTLAQPTSNPTIDLTASNVTQDITVPLGTINFAIYNAQGYSVPNSNLTADITDVNSGSSVVLYPGGAPATLNKESSPGRIYTTGTTGTGSFKAIVGMKFTGASSNRICSWSNYNIQLLCVGPYTVVSGTSSLDIPQTPAPRNTFSGVLKDSDGNTLSNITTTLTDAYGNSVAANTDNTGGFSLSVQPGMYSLRINTNTTVPGLGTFTLGQSTSNPTIDLTSGNKVQDITVPLATVNFAIYNTQGYSVPNSKLTFDATDVNSGSSVTLYPGGAPATLNKESSPSYISGGTTGTGSFKAIVGMKFTGASSNAICSWTNNNIKLLCLPNSYTITEGTSNLDIPQTPAPKKSFSGIIKDSDGNTLSNIAVRLTDAYYNSVATNTGGSGDFELSVQPGMYSLTVNTNNVIPGLGTFTLGQSTSNPTIDLTTNDTTQDITIPLATVNFSIHDTLGNPYANTNLTFDATDVNSGSSVVLYPGGAPATLNKESSPGRIYTTGTTGTGSFKAIVGMKFTGASSNRICSWTSYNILIQCLSDPYTIANGISSINVP